MFSSLLKWNDVTLSKILCIAFLEFWKHDPYLPGLCESGNWLGYHRKSNPIMLTDLDWGRDSSAVVGQGMSCFPGNMSQSISGGHLILVL